MRKVETNAQLDRYLGDIGEYALLTREEENDLATRAQAGDGEARQQLVKGNLRLVVKIALDYVGMGLPLPDLVSEGNIGLMRASELFDPTVGAKFSTYAALWIKQRIRRAISNQSRTVRVPIWRSQLLRQIRRATDSLTTKLGRQPTDLEVAAEAGVELDDVERSRKAAVQVYSLDASLNPEDPDEATLSNTLPDEQAANPSEDLGQKEMLTGAMASLNVLSDKELKILALRFGLHGQEERTLESIGKDFNVSRERIRQLQEVALTKIRRHFMGAGKTQSDEEAASSSSEVSQRLKAIFDGSTPLETKPTKAPVKGGAKRSRKPKSASKAAAIAA